MKSFCLVIVVCKFSFFRYGLMWFVVIVDKEFLYDVVLSVFWMGNFFMCLIVIGLILVSIWCVNFLLSIYVFLEVVNDN